MKKILFCMAAFMLAGCGDDDEEIRWCPVGEGDFLHIVAPDTRIETDTTPDAGLSDSGAETRAVPMLDSVGK